MSLTHLFLRKQEVDKVDELNTHMRISNVAVQYNGDRPCELEVQVDILAVVRLGVDLSEQLWEGGQILEDKLWQSLEIEGQGGLIPDCIVKETVQILEQVCVHVDLTRYANDESMRKAEKLPVQDNCVFAEDMGIHADLLRHDLVKLLVVLLGNHFV
jgi:hypothetical protein